MTTKVWTGSAGPVAQVTNVTPSNPEVGDVFTITINGKSASYTVLITDIDDPVVGYVPAVVAGLVGVCNTAKTSYPEFAELTFSIGSTDGKASHVIVTGASDGTPFTISLSTTNGIPPAVQVTETVKGYAGKNEVQRVQIAGTATGGTFTLTFDGDTTGNIAYDATANDVRDELCDLSTLAGTDEVQEVTQVAATATGGTFTLTYDGQTTGAIAYNASAATVDAALEALSNIGAGDVVCSGGPLPGAAIVVTFREALGRQEVPEMTGDGALLTGPDSPYTIAVSTTTPGVDADVLVTGAAGGPWDVEFREAWQRIDAPLITGDGALVTKAASGYAVTVTTIQEAVAGQSEIQRISLGSGVSGGTFTLSYSGATTAALAWDISAANLKTALDALAGIDTVTVSAATGYWDVTFGGTQQYSDVSLLVGDGSSLTGGITVGVVTTQEGRPGIPAEWDVVIPPSMTFRILYRDPSGVVNAPAVTTGFYSSYSVAEVQAVVDAYLTSYHPLAVGKIVVSKTTSPVARMHFTAAGSAAYHNYLTFEADALWLTSEVPSYAPFIYTAPDATSQDEIQVVTLPTTPTGGTFTLTFEGETTGNIAYNASAATVEAALEALSNLAPADVAVTGSAGGPWTVTFSLSRDCAILTGDGSSLTGAGVYVTVIQTASLPINEQERVAISGSPQGGTFTLTFEGETTGNIAYDASSATVQTALEGLATPVPGDFIVSGVDAGPWIVEFTGNYAGTNVTEMTGDPALLSGADILVSAIQIAAASVNEVQRVTLLGAPTGGTFTLTYSAQTTGDITYNAPATEVQMALESLSNIAVGDVQVTGVPGGPWSVAFLGALAAQDIAAMTGSGAGLVSPGTQNLTQTTPTTPTGPNWFDNVNNWSTGTAPATNDDLVFRNNATPVKYGLSQSSITPASIDIQASYAQGGRIGLPKTNANGYTEYRTTELTIGSNGAGGTNLVIDIGFGEGQGSDLIRLNTGTKRTLLTINQTATSGETNLPSVCWRGTHVLNSVQILRGSLGIAVEPGQTAVVATLQQGFVENQTSDSSVECGSGVTLGTVTKSGGDAICFCGIASVQNTGGTIEVAGAGNVVLVDIQGGTFYASTTGELGKRGVITGITQADPAVVSSATHGLAVGDVVRIANVVGMTEVNQREFVVRAVPTAGSFSLLGCDSTAYTAYSSGGVWGKVGSVQVALDGSIDFSRRMDVRAVAVPIDVYGNTAEVIDRLGVAYTETYATTQFVLDYHHASPNDDLPGDRRVIWERRP